MAGDGELSAAAPDADGGCGGGDDDRLVEIVDIRCTVHNAAAAAGYLVPPLPSAIAGAVAVIVAGREMGPADTRDDGKRVSSCQTDRDSGSLDKHSCASVAIQLYTSSVSSMFDTNRGNKPELAKNASCNGYEPPSYQAVGSSYSFILARSIYSVYYLNKSL